MPNSKKINKELSLISRYASLKYSKYILLSLLAITYYKMHGAQLYIFFALFFTPLILGLADSTRQEEENGTEGFTLLYTARKHNFTIQGYRNEKYSYIITLFLMVIWQVNINRRCLYVMPLKAVPSILIIVYILAQISIGTFIKYKTKYNFMNLKI